jgi:hypothetical protein
VNRWLFVGLGVVCGLGCESTPAAGEHALKAALEAATAKRSTRVEAADFEDDVRTRRWLSRGFAGRATRLGDVRLSWAGKFVLRDAQGSRASRDEKLTVELSPTGDYTLRHENVWSVESEAGVEVRACWRRGDAFFAARNDGPASRLLRDAGEAEACLDSALEPVTGWLSLSHAQLRFTVSGNSEALGRRVLEVDVEVDPERLDSSPPWALGSFFQSTASGTVLHDPVPGPRPPLVLTHGRLQRAGGRFQVDVETGTPLVGRLEATIALVKLDTPLTLELEMSWSASRRTEPLSTPAEIEVRRPRARPFADRDAILGPALAPESEGSGLALPKPGDAPPLILGPAEGAVRDEEPLEAEQTPR